MGELEHTGTLETYRYAHWRLEIMCTAVLQRVAWQSRVRFGAPWATLAHQTRGGNAVVAVFEWSGPHKLLPLPASPLH